MGGSVWQDYESVIKPAGQLKKKNPTPKQTKTCHHNWGNSMQRENVLDNILIDSNLFLEYANIKKGNIWDTSFLPCCRKLQTHAPYTFLLQQTD